KRGLEDAVLVRKLRLELAHAPARIDGKDPPPRRRRDDLARLGQRGKAARAEERYGSVIGIEELAQHEDGLGLHRATDPDLVAVVDHRLALWDGPGNIDRGGSADGQPRRAILAVLRPEDGGAAVARPAPGPPRE